MANKRPLVENPLEDMDITNIVRSITNDTADAGATAVADDAEASVAAPKPKAPKRPSKGGHTVSKAFADQLINNYLRYDKSSEKGKPI